MSFPTKLSFVPKLNFYKNLKPPSRYLFPLPPPYGGIKNQMGPKLIFYKNLKPPSRYLSPLPPPFGGIKNQRGYFFSSLTLFLNALGPITPTNSSSSSLPPKQRRREKQEESLEASRGRKSCKLWNLLQLRMMRSTSWG